jgi:thioesterase domain-containing protein
MGVRVLVAGVERVVLEAPLGPNRNHRSTAFGGSVAALATLAGWALVHLGLREDGLSAQTVIQSGDIRYDAPVHAEFRASCGPVPEREWDRFVRALTKRGRGRVRVQVTVESEDVAAASFQGAYVALRGPEGGPADGRERPA